VDERAHDRIPGRVRHGAMEVDVVDEKRVRIVAVGEQAGDFVGKRREMLG